MSRLPLEDRRVYGVPGPDYFPKDICAHPFCSERNPVPTKGYHHLWPRSFLRNQPQTWVKLPDGKEVGNLVYLCRKHQQRVTENESKILYGLTLNKFFWYDGYDTIPMGALDPQPPRAYEVDQVEAINAAERLTEPPSHTHEELPERFICPTCHRRINAKRKPTTPATKVISFRLPIANAPEWEEIIEAAAKHVGVTEESFWKWRVIERGLVELLQGPGYENQD